MSNREMNAFLRVGPPAGVKLSSLEYGLFLHLCHRYDTRDGFKSAYPGGEELRLASTKSRSAIEGALGKLKAKGMIIQVQKGYTGNRAEYVPIYAINLLNDEKSVAYVNTLKDEVSPLPTESVSNTGRESRVDEQRVSSTPVTISTVSNVNTNKYDLVRFNLIVLSALPERLRTLSPGVNYEKLLDECDELGIAEEVRRVIATNRWDNVTGNPGGIVAKLIKEAIERKRSGQLVAPVAHTTPQPSKYVEEVVEVASPETREKYLKQIREGFGKTFGSIPE